MDLIPANFYTQLESKKWTDRKEVLEILEKNSSAPRLDNADYSELVRALKKTVAKDSNIAVVTSAAKCICQLAQGLGRDFAPYANGCLSILFEKFKEKKTNVIGQMRDAADACFMGTNIENIHEDVIKFLDNKNPQIKSEMALFIARTFSHYPDQVMNKKTLRPITNALIKTLSDMDATVRDYSAMAIGTAMKVSGEKLMMTLIADVDPIKVTKIKEHCEKAEIVTAQTNGKEHAGDGIQNGMDNVALGQNNNINDVAPGDDDDADERAYEMLDAVDISAQIPANFFTQLESKKWSERKEVLETLEKITSVPKIQNSDFNELIRALKKTVAKDSNIAVVTSAAKCICQLAQGLRKEFAIHANGCIAVMFERFKEKKTNVIGQMRDAADACFLGTNIENIHEDVIKFLDSKNPQIKSEMALFIARTFSQHPIEVMNKKTLRPIINALIKTLSDMDATVRDNSALAIGTAMKVTGEKLMMTLIADVEPIKISKIKEHCEKVVVKKLPKSAMSNMAPAPAAPMSAPAPAPMSAPTRKSFGAPQSAATIKRTATIIKRSNEPKRNVTPSANHASHNTIAPPPSFAPQQQHTNALATQNNNNNNNIASHHPATQQNNVLAPPNIDFYILRLLSEDDAELFEALDTLEKLANKTKISQIIDLACIQLVKSVIGGQSLRIKKVSDFFVKLFTRRELVSAASQQTTRLLLVQLFAMAQTCDDLNHLACAVIDNNDPTNIMSILTGLLNDPPLSIVDPIKRAIVRAMRSFQ